MHSLDYSGLGTVWTILIDSKKIPHHLKQTLADQISDFESKYSRFLPDSEITKLNQQTGSVVISTDLHNMINLGLELHSLTDGYFDLNIATLISGLGYDSNYTFRENKQLLDQQRGSYRLEKNRLVQQGSVFIDLGALGKGYLIDRIADTIKSSHLEHFLIDGGGDLYGTHKSDHSPWKVAIEHPTDNKSATGVISLLNQGLATSSSQKRRFNGSHHLIDPKKQTSTDELLSVTTIATSAFVADATATAIFVSPEQFHSKIAKKFEVEYCTITPDFHIKTSTDFPADFIG